MDDKTQSEFYRQGETGEIADDREMAEAIKKRPPSRRNPLLMILVVAFSVYLMWDMRNDMYYYLKWPEPVFLGRAEDPVTANFKEGAYAVIRGVPDPRKAQIQATTLGIYSTYYLYFAYVGNKNILVRDKISELEQLQRKRDVYDSSPKTGRLHSFEAFPGRMELEQVRQYFRDKFGREFPEDSWILIAGETPWKSVQYPIAYLLLVGFIVYNCHQLYRRFFEK
jgi:hypothetical protein